MLGGRREDAWNLDHCRVGKMQVGRRIYGTLKRSRGSASRRTEYVKRREVTFQVWEDIAWGLDGSSLAKVECLPFSFI